MQYESPVRAHALGSIQEASDRIRKIREKNLLHEATHGLSERRLDSLMDALLIGSEKPNPLPKPEANTPHTPRPKITEHQERAFIFSDGTKKQSCPVEDCRWGQATAAGGFVKKHCGLTDVPEVDVDVDVDVDGDDVDGDDVEVESEEVDVDGTMPTLAESAGVCA